MSRHKPTGKPRAASTEYLESLIEQGQSPKEIAAKVGCTLNTVYRHLREYSLVRDRYLQIMLTAEQFIAVQKEAKRLGMTRTELVQIMLAEGISEFETTRQPRRRK